MGQQLEPEADPEDFDDVPKRVVTSYIPPPQQPDLSYDVADTDVELWQCSACTFMNHPALKHCECCEMPQITIVPAALSGVPKRVVTSYIPPPQQPDLSYDVADTDVELWQCSACTFMNHPALKHCECCEMPQITIVPAALSGERKERSERKERRRLERKERSERKERRRLERKERSERKERRRLGTTIKFGEDKMSPMQTPGSSNELKKTDNDALCQSAHDNLNTHMKSVGSLIGQNSSGTVFVVGKKYVMTAWHVVRDIVQDSSGFVDTTKLDPVFINFNEDPNQLCGQPYFLKRDIAFVDVNLDVAVLEIKDPSNLPNSVLLYKDDVTCTYLADISLCGFGQPGSNKKHMEHGCTIIKPNSKRIKAAQYHLQAESNHLAGITNSNYYKAALAMQGKKSSLVDSGYSGFDDESKLLFSCFMEHGASGAPVLTANLVPGSVYAVGVLTSAIPQFFFEMPKLVQSNFPDEYRFEMGAKMSHVFRSMCQRNLSLAQKLF